MASSKGKEKIIEGNSSKRKRNSIDNDMSGGRKRRHRAVLQFFEHSACEVDGNSSDDEVDFDVAGFLEDEYLNDVKANNEPVELPLVSFIREEEVDVAKLEKMVEERFGIESTLVRYAKDEYDNREATDWDEYHPLLRDPTFWKVKCTVGREKHSVFCLMQKYVDLQTLGTKLQIISAFSLDHVKGFIYIEAESQQDMYEACRGLFTIYVSKVTPVPPNEWSYILSVKSKGCGIAAGMWARMKSGKYKGDLAQIMAINEVRKKATVKLIPRIDLRALAEKFGGGVSVKRSSTRTPPRMISSHEIKEFSPLIQMRRDRDTNTSFEVLDGMMLKDGYLYKKIPVDSLNVWGAMPTEDELLKFEPANNYESMDLVFLSDLYGNEGMQIMKSDKRVENGEGSSTPKEYSFEVHDLVFFGKKDFGVIIGMEKDDNLKIMKGGTEGPLILTLPARDLKSASFDKKLFTTQDLHMKKISISDRVRILDGPLKDKEGVVKHIYKGTIFLFNESEEEHNGYTCFKSQTCEKVTSAGQASHEQGNDPGPSVFGESPSSPNSTLSPKTSWQGRENSSFNQADKNSTFSVGQSLRIKVGPLKGYLCRAFAIRRSDVTVKIDSQQKLLTVKSEHLSEVRGRSSAIVIGGDQESAEPFDLLGTTDGSRGGSTRGKASESHNTVTNREVDRWGDHAEQQRINKEGDDRSSLGKRDIGSSWKIKESESTRSKQVKGSLWNKSAGSSWSKPTGTSFGQQAEARAEVVHDRTESNRSWGNQADSSWNKQACGSSWKGKDSGSGLNKTAGGSWGKKDDDRPEEAYGTTEKNRSWGGQGGSSLKKQDGGPACHKPASSSWGQEADAKVHGRNYTNDQQPSWGKNEGGSWNKQDDISRDNEGRSSWKKPNEGSSWKKPTCSKPPSGSTWGMQAKPSDWSSSGREMKSKLFNQDQSTGWGNYSSCNQNNAGNSNNFSRGRGRRGSWGGRGGRGKSGTGGFEGRGGSGRGGFRGRVRGFGGRDGSEQRGYGGRGRSDRGVTRGRGRSNYGGRGLGRADHYGGDWNNSLDFGEEKAPSWSADGGNWDQGGADSWQWKGWSTGSSTSGVSWSKPGNNGGWNKGLASGSGNKVGMDGDGEQKCWSSGGRGTRPGNPAARFRGKSRGRY